MSLDVRGGEGTLTLIDKKVQHIPIDNKCFFLVVIVDIIDRVVVVGGGCPGENLLGFFLFVVYGSVWSVW